MINSHLHILSLRIELRLQCPQCKRYNLVRSDNIDIYFYCPDISCGYVIRNGCSPEDKSKDLLSLEKTSIPLKYSSTLFLVKSCPVSRANYNVHVRLFNQVDREAQAVFELPLTTFSLTQNAH